MDRLELVLAAPATLLSGDDGNDTHCDLARARRHVAILPRVMERAVSAR